MSDPGLVGAARRQRGLVAKCHKVQVALGGRRRAASAWARGEPWARADRYSRSASAARQAARPSRQCGSSGAPFSLRRIETGGPRRPRAELRRRDPPHPAVEPRLLEDRLGEVRPRAVAGRGEVPDAERRRRVDELARRRGQMADVGRAAALVVDDRDLVPLRPEPEHRAHEVVPGRAEEPRAPHDPGVLAGRGLAVELRPPVGGQRARAVRLDVRRSLAAVEDVVGGVRDERRPELRRVRRAADVHLRGPLRIVLGAVDVRPRGGVQHELRPLERGRGREPDVPVLARQRAHVVRGERRCERDAELAAAPVIRTRRPECSASGPGPRGSVSACSTGPSREGRPTGCRARRGRPGRTPRSRGRRTAGR